MQTPVSYWNIVNSNTVQTILICNLGTKKIFHFSLSYREPLICVTHIVVSIIDIFYNSIYFHDPDQLFNISYWLYAYTKTIIIFINFLHNNAQYALTTRAGRSFTFIIWQWNCGYS